MQIFPRSINKLPATVAIALLVAGGGATGFVWYYFSPRNTQVGYGPRQPVPYSHRLHAGVMGMDCRYCHVNVERSAVASVPPAQTCMNCHQTVRTESAMLQPIRHAFATGDPVEWVRVHRLPDHAYFDHSIHVSAGVGCVTCHGRIDQMDVVRQAEPLNMAWCLDCHRNPTPNLRPVSEVTNMNWQPTGTVQPPRHINPPTHCSGCHR